MTYDERQEIAVYIDIVKKNCSRLMHSIEMLQDKIGEMHCELTEADNANRTQTTKESFLKDF